MTQVLYSTLKKEYSKSNLLRREAILKKYGFAKEEDYLSFLTYQLKKVELKESIKDLSEKINNKTPKTKK